MLTHYLKKLLSIYRYFEPRHRFISELPASAKVLDCGCGDLVSTRKLYESNRHLEWHCLDQNISVTDSRFSLYEIDAEKSTLNFKNDYFDAIIILHMLEHLSDYKLFASEIRRILKPGGMVFVEVPSYMTLFAPTSKKFFSMTGNFYDDLTHIKPFTIPSISYLLQHIFKLDLIKGGSVRNLLRIVAFPVLLPASILLWRAMFMMSVGDLLGYRIYFIAKKTEKTKISSK